MAWRRLLAAVLCVPSLLVLSGCEEDLKGPDPSVDNPVGGEELPVDPGIICRVQNPDEGTPVVVTGEQLAPVAFDVPNEPRPALPDVTLLRSNELDGADGDGMEFMFGGQPGDTNASLLSWESQTQMTFRVTDGLQLERGVYDIRVTNPQDSSATSAGALAVVDRPFVDGVAPGITCVAQGDRQVTVSGQEILRIGDGEAEAIIGGNTYPVDELSDCTPVAHEGIDAEICTTATVTIPEADLMAGEHPVEIQNPETAACKSVHDDDQINLQLVDPPEITGAEPPLICTDEMDRALTLIGTNFFTVDGTNPTVTVAGADVTVDGVSGCSDVAVEGLTVQQCTEINVTVPQGSLDEGSVEITVENPDPIGCSGSSGSALVVPPTVAITSVEPAQVCQANAGMEDLTVTGVGFLSIDGTDFSVTFDGNDVTPSNISGCTSLMVDGMMVDACTEFTISVDLTGASAGPREVTVTNPAPSGCSTTATDLFNVTQPPTVSSVAPSNICSGVAETITVNGSDFAPGATVTVGSTQADMVTVAGDGNSLMATFSNGIDAGTYDVTVSNGMGCSDTLASAITVDPTPIVFFVDPPTIYNDVSTEVTIFTSGLAATAQDVTLIDSNGMRTALMNFTSPTRPNRIQAVVPSGLPADTYEVEVTSDIGCTSINNGTLVISDSVNLTGLEIDPSFASPTGPTAVTIDVDSSTPFISTPRAYLNPNPAGANSTATALRAVVYRNPTTLTAVIPGGLTPGDYDLIVVNPDGDIGFLAQAVTVTTGEPPVIQNVVPQTFANDSDYAGEIRGANFDTGGVSVDLRCEDPTSGNVTTFAATVNNTAANTVDVTFPTSSISNGAVCLVDLTNPDGSSFTFSAISVSNPAFNLYPWSATSPMSTARRGLSLEAGRPTFASRFLYAIGGDDGTTGGAMSSVESVGVDVFGDLGSWSAEANSLPEPKTLAGVQRIGRFIYVVGGNDGTSATDTVFRAQILDPLETPEITDVDAALGGGSGLGEGIWHYRVAAVFPSSDPSNPDGESLPGEVQVLDLPDVTEQLHITLTWEQIQGASGYRVYRTANAGDSVDDLELLAEVSGGSTLSYTDMGGSTDGSVTPLPQGSLGTWHPAGTLNTKREATTAVAGVDPNDSDMWHLYAIGGRDENGTYLDSIEYATITVAADGSQTVSNWSTATATLTEARAELGSYRVTNDQTSDIPAGETWLYIGPGRTSSTSINSVFSGFQVPAGGDPSTVTVVNPAVKTSRAGYGFGASNDFAYIFGGANGGPSDDGINGTFTGTTSMTNNSWNSLGISMSDSRVFMGSAQESAFYFIAGGWDGTSALSSVDQTVQ